MRHTRWLLILSILLAATVAAQDKPDFSGRWILETAANASPDVARSLTVRQPVVRTNVFGAPMLPFFKEISVERQFVTDVRAETYQIGVEGGMLGGGQPIDVSSNRRRQHLDGNRSLQIGVRGLVHLTHTAHANLGEDFIRAEASTRSQNQFVWIIRAEQWWQRIGPGTRRSVSNAIAY